MSLGANKQLKFIALALACALWLPVVVVLAQNSGNAVPPPPPPEVGSEADFPPPPPETVQAPGDNQALPPNNPATPPNTAPQNTALPATPPAATNQVPVQPGQALPPATARPNPTGALPAGVSVNPGDLDVSLFLEPYNYDPTGRRDPFIPSFGGVGPGGSVQNARPLLPLERFELEQIKLVGIIWDVKEPKAMFKDPTDKVYVLGKDQRIGRNQGYIAVIREGEVVVVESVLKEGEVTYTTRTMPLITEAEKK